MCVCAAKNLKLVPVIDSITLNSRPINQCVKAFKPRFVSAGNAFKALLRRLSLGLGLGSAACRCWRRQEAGGQVLNVYKQLKPQIMREAINFVKCVHMKVVKKCLRNFHRKRHAHTHSQKKKPTKILRHDFGCLSNTSANA